MSQLQQTIATATAQVQRALVLGRLNIDFNQSSFGLDGYFRKLLVIDGEQVPDRVFGPETHRVYQSEDEFRQAIRDAVTINAQLQQLQAGITQDPSLMVDLIAALMFGLYAADLLAADNPEVFE
jgi:hypothetical protein